MRSLLSLVTESKFMRCPAYDWKWVYCENILSCKDITVLVCQGMSCQFPTCGTLETGGNVTREFLQNGGLEMGDQDNQF